MIPSYGVMGINPHGYIINYCPNISIPRSLANQRCQAITLTIIATKRYSLVAAPGKLGSHSSVKGRPFYFSAHGYPGRQCGANIISWPCNCKTSHTPNHNTATYIYIQTKMSLRTLTHLLGVFSRKHQLCIMYCVANLANS